MEVESFKIKEIKLSIYPDDMIFYISGDWKGWISGIICGILIVSEFFLDDLLDFHYIFFIRIVSCIFFLLSFYYLVIPFLYEFGEL